MKDLNAVAISNVVRFVPKTRHEPLFSRVPIDLDSRDVALKEIDDCLGGVLQLTNLAFERREKLGEMRLDPSLFVRIQDAALQLAAVTIKLREGGDHG